MQLDDRKQKILYAVIRNYLETGEPVGSRTISKYTDLNLSSATIRNEMSDLEEMGFIYQPHTSSGRIPSDQGYRLYVDAMMKEKNQEVSQMKELLLEKEDRMERLLQKVAKVLAINTEYATMISTPSTYGNKLKFIQLSRVDEHQLLAVIVAEGNVIKNRMIEVEKLLNDETLLKLNMLLNTNLNGIAIEEINLAMITKLKKLAGPHREIVGGVMDAVGQSIKEEDLEIYTSGTNNILKYPELSEHNLASEIINTFEEKQILSTFLTESDEIRSENHAIKVYIGEETSIGTMKDCSVVTASYELEEGIHGTIGIVGPKRMDYDKVVETLKTVQNQLDLLYKKERRKGDDET